MKILFVCSGNRGISPIVQAQADSIVNLGHDVQIFPIVGKGLAGYLKSIPELRRFASKIHPDVIHAHYSFCGIAASMAGFQHVVVSLMGSDVIHSGLWRKIIAVFIKYVWSSTIVKSHDMLNRLMLSKPQVIPNGVDLEVFKPMDRIQCREKLGWRKDNKIIIFTADPGRVEKNYTLAREAVDSLNIDDVELIPVYNVKHRDIATYMNASNLLLLTSKWEGSPNVVKEAMACNTGVVSTKVGDVQWLFGDTMGYQTCDANPEIIGKAITRALEMGDVSTGRDRLVNLQLDSRSVAERIIGIYKREKK